MGIILHPTVRLFEKADLAAVLRIENASFDRDAWPRDVFVEYAAATPDLFLIARVTGRIAGYSIACLTRHGAEIASLAVHPRYRERGIATVLLKSTIRKLRRAGAPALWLMVRPRNASAIRLYRKSGFIRVGTVPNYYGANSPGWRMRLKLRSGS